MPYRKLNLLTSTGMQMLLGVGVVAGGSLVLSACAESNTGYSSTPAKQTAAATNPCAAKKGCNPCAAKKACNPCAAKGGCNPCAAKKACNPCAAKKGCNPCAANACNPCNPCNPCGGGAVTYSEKCVVPRLVTAALCNPCAAKKGCNPCAAKACNPCAAKKGCNPCAVKKACNPCAANACNPCGADEAPELTLAEARALYDCLRPEMQAGYRASEMEVAVAYTGWKSFNARPYPSATHGGRLVNNYTNGTGAAAYGKFEEVGRVPIGSVMAKDSFVVHPDGKASVGPLFLMEKMPAGFREDSDDWKYTMVMPTGAVAGVTNGKGDKVVEFCIGCHMSVSEDQDSLMLIPDEYRAE
ncbi:MAG: hypothetical protein RIM84_13075 [Alphaproteobacteria bacterium]